MINQFNFIMNLNDNNVLDILNKIIMKERLNKNQILKLVNLTPISNDIKDLKENLLWDNSVNMHNRYK